MATLFERLEAASSAGGTVPRDPQGIPLRESVLANIRHVLNQRQGCCQTRLDYGLPDLNGLAHEAAEAAPAIARAVKSQLDAFEPRLRDVVVRPIAQGGHPGEMAFAVSAVLLDGDGGRAMRFETILGDDRQMRLRL